MLRLSAKKIVILAAICFAGLVAMQVAWIQSAYNGEVALYTRAKRQFESELQSELRHNEQFKAGLKELLDHYNEEQGLGRAQTDWFYQSFLQAVQFNPKRSQFDVDVHRVSIVRLQHHDTASTRTINAVPVIPQMLDSLQVAKAGKLCVHCILGLKEELHSQYNYQILLFYKNQWDAFFGKLGFLILLSLILLIILGFLFREILKRYNTEKKLSEAKNDFINNLTHEMQTPVFAIQMANRLIKEKTGEEPGITPLTRIIEKEAGQLKLHAGKILDLASLEQGQVAMDEEVTELNSFIEQRRLTIELMLKEKKGSLTIRNNANPLYCKIDQVHFNNVLTSLVDNAIKYSKDIPEVLIETGTMKDGMVYLKVADNGIGINREYLPFIFDKFFRVPHVKRNGITGFGLGLSYVSKIVELHNGQIKVSSEEGMGTTVTILLPKATGNA